MTDTPVPAQPPVQFGLQPPTNAVRAWGARAIYKVMPEPYIDILWDRTGHYTSEAEPTAESTHFFGDEHIAGWIKAVGMPWLRAHVKRTWLSASSRERVAMVDGNCAIAACPNGSYGYLYIVAYEVPEGEVPLEIVTPTPPPPPPHPGSVRHEFRPAMSYGSLRFTCDVCGERKSAKIHPSRR